MARQIEAICRASIRFVTDHEIQFFTFRERPKILVPRQERDASIYTILRDQNVPQGALRFFDNAFARNAPARSQ
jgi:hypothetical protein